MKNSLSKALLAAGGSALLLLAGACQKAPSAPSVILSDGRSATENSITFSIEAADAYWVSYMVLPSYEKAPVADVVLSDGEKAGLGKAEVTVDGLDPGIEYFVYAAAESSAGVSELASLSVRTEGSSYVVVSSQTNVWYYGQQTEGTNQFLLQLADVECEEYQLRPQDAGQLIRLYLITEPLEDGETPALQPGVYTCGKPGEEVPGTFTITADGSGYTSQYGTGLSSDLETWGAAAINGGELTVGLNDDGTYSITARLTVDDGNNTLVIGRYEGTVVTEDLSDGIRYFYKDISGVEYNSFGATVTSGTSADSWSATLVNAPVDEYGFIAGAGYVMSLSFYTPAAPAGEISIEGTYSAADEIKEYSYYPGYIYDMFGMIMPVATNLTYYGEDGNIQYTALITGGDIVISKDGENYHVEAENLTTNTGYSVSFVYDGPFAPVNDYRTPASGSATPAAASPLGAGNAGLPGPWIPAR